MKIAYFRSSGKTQDTLRDLFSRLKEASKTHKAVINVPYSQINYMVLSKFYDKGLIATFYYNSMNNVLVVNLKYDFVGRGLLHSLKWFSLPSRRIYYPHKLLRTFDNKYTYLFFTERGLYFLDEILKLKSGGEMLCEILG